MTRLHYSIVYLRIEQTRKRRLYPQLAAMFALKHIMRTLALRSDIYKKHLLTLVTSVIVMLSRLCKTIQRNSGHECMKMHSH